MGYMAETVLGTGVVWGIAGTTITGTGIGSHLAQSSSLSIDSEMVEIKNGDGETVGTVHYNSKETFTMDVIPTGATLSLIASRAANIMPAVGALITVADTDDPYHTSKKFIFISGSKGRSNTDVAKLSFTMIRWTANDVAVAVGV